MSRFAQSTDGWPTIEEAAAQLGTSVRSMWRHAKARRIEMRKRPRPGKKPANVCNPADIDKLMPAEHVMPAEEKTAAVTQWRAKKNGAGRLDVTALEAIATILTTQHVSGIGRISPAQKVWLNLEEAQAYYGRTRAFLLRLCREGRIEAVKDGGWRIKRASLEEPVT